MVAYSIKDLENLSGVKAHTLRIWEKRYNIIQPSRTDTNIRYYSEVDLQRILNISLLNRHGIKISHIATMSCHELKHKVAEFSKVSSAFEDQLDSLMLSMIELDEAKFSTILDYQITSRGFEETINDIVYPLLDKLATMWMVGSAKSIHENFVSNIIKRKIYVEIDRISTCDCHCKFRCLIYLPENENHELSLLFLHYLLIKNNAKVINLGINVPLVDVLEARMSFKASYLFTLFNDSFADQSLQPYLDELTNNIEDCQVLISGYQMTRQHLTLPPNVKIMYSIDDVKKYIFSQTSCSVKPNS